MFEDSEKPQPESERDLSEIFDLSRKKLTGSMVDRMESCMRQADAARDDLKQVVAECKEANFSRRDIEAMKKIAQLRKDDKAGTAREQLEALEKVGKAVGFDLFTWASTAA